MVAAGSTPARGVMVGIATITGLVAAAALVVFVGAMLFVTLVSLRRDRHSPPTDRG